MKEKTVKELKQMMDSGEDFQLIDVREEHEYEAGNIGGEFIPMNTIPDNVDRISKDKPVIVHCRGGQRSSNVVHFLENKYGYVNLYNLKGGIFAYSHEIDPTVYVL